MAIYRSDIVDIELKSGTVFRSFMNHAIGSGDEKANRFGVRLFRDGEPVSAESATVTGLFMAPDGTRYVISETSWPGSTGAEGNEAYVQLPGICYAVTGKFTLAIKLSGGGVEGTMRIVDGMVDETGEDGAVVPTSTIPATADIIEAYEEAVAVMGGSVRFDATQSLTSAEKATARENIEAAAQVLIAPKFSTSANYTIGQYCTYNGKMYRFTTVHPAGSWNSAHVVETNTGAEINWLLTERVPHFPNINIGAYGALTFNYDSENNVYSIEANKSFSVFGFSTFKNIVSFGCGSTVDYPMPESFSASDVSTGTFAFICYDKNDNSSATWKIVSTQTFVGNPALMAIAAAYKDRVYFFDDNLKVLFTNSVNQDAFLNYETNRIRSTAFYYPFLCNATAILVGSVNFIPAEYKVVITNPIIGPNSSVGGFNSDFNQQTITLDWSEEENPNFARFIYFDNSRSEFVAVCSSVLTAEEREAYRKNKAAMALLCAVYQGTFVYTCGACTPGKWFVNGRDIYGGASSEFPPDLFKTFKRVGVIGDSLSVGYMMNKKTGVVTSRMLAYSWVKKCMNDAGVPWLNLGTSGQSVLTWCTNTTYGKVQAEAENNTCQAYIIGLGENDQSDSVRGIPLGAPSDIVDDYTHVATTYYGGYARIIQILKHLNPDCKIFCLTNPRTGTGRAAYNVAVRYIAETYYTPDDNVFLVDLASDDPTLFNGGTFLPVDSATITGGHYSAVGYARIASIMEKAITKAMEANQAHFIDVAYIPYDTGDPTANTMTE